MNEIVQPPHLEMWPRKAFFKRMLWSAAGACALGGLYAGKFGRDWVRIERREMPLPNLGGALAGKTLAHISDLHSSPIVLERYLSQCVRLVNSLEVDFVAITGDFITGAWRRARRVSKILGRLRPNIATLACLGNHDYGVLNPSGLGQLKGLSFYLAEQLTRADVFVMMNESRTFSIDGATIQFVGLEDYWTDHFDPPAAFEMTRPHHPMIALCHNPDAAHMLARCGADWVLAGHTHGFDRATSRVRKWVIPAKHKEFCAGHYDLPGGKSLYVNRGMSYGRRVRLNTRPEITLFTFTDAEAIDSTDSIGI